VVSTFTEAMTFAPEVSEIFGFGGELDQAIPVDSGLASRTAVGLVANSVSNSAMYGFSQTVDGGAAQSYWQSQLSSPDALNCSQALYAWAFPDNCKSPSGSCFADYQQQQPATAAQQLAQYVTTTQFINADIAELIAGQEDWLARLNLVFYKLQLLDPALVPNVLSAWQSAYPDKGIVVNWSSYRLIAVQTYSATQFINEVNQSIGQSSQRTVQAPPDGPPGHEEDGGQLIQTVMGAAVEDFVNGPANAAGLATGTPPDNVVDSESPPEHDNWGLPFGGE
jgi:hypothetical protein